MIDKEILSREQIIREVTPIGNGAHIFAPKNWMGERVVIIRTPEISLKKRALKILEPYLEHTLGVYLYGSYARGEQRQDSDIDLLIISNKKFKLKEKGFEIIVLEKDKIDKAIKIAPVLIYSALAEARPIINSELLSDLKKNYAPNIKYLREYIEETKNMIKINEEFLDVYSIILRLRGIYVIENILSRERYSYKGFKNWIFESSEDGESIKTNFDGIYNAYIKIKNGFRASVKESYLKALLLILKKKTERLEKRLYGKKEKAA